MNDDLLGLIIAAVITTPIAVIVSAIFRKFDMDEQKKHNYQHKDLREVHDEYHYKVKTKDWPKWLR
jgi:hypothetical protein